MFVAGIVLSFHMNFLMYFFNNLLIKKQSYREVKRDLAKVTQLASDMAGFGVLSNGFDTQLNCFSFSNGGVCNFF